MLKQGPSYGDVMWVRHNQDKGMWWPGLFVSLKAEKALLVTVRRFGPILPNVSSLFVQQFKKVASV